MNVFDKLIDKAHSPAQPQPVAGRSLFAAVTLLAWSLYLYLWAPVLTLLLWLLGIRSSYIQLYIQSNQVNVGLLAQLLLIALGCSALLLGWAEYNRIRFQGMDRRGRQSDASLADVARCLGASEALARELQASRQTVIVMSEKAIPLALRHHHGSALSTSPASRDRGLQDSASGGDANGLLGQHA